MSYGSFLKSLVCSGVHLLKTNVSSSRCLKCSASYPTQVLIKNLVCSCFTEFWSQEHSGILVYLQRLLRCWPLLSSWVSSRLVSEVSKSLREPTSSCLLVRPSIFVTFILPLSFETPFAMDEYIFVAFIFSFDTEKSIRFLCKQCKYLSEKTLRIN